MDTAHLIIQVGTEPERELRLTRSDILIGRDAGNELVTKDAEVSRRHARIILDSSANGYVLQDLGSTNGSYVNGRRITGSQLLRDGDVITMGRIVRLQFASQASEAPTVAMESMDVAPPASPPQAQSPYAPPSAQYNPPYTNPPAQYPSQPQPQPQPQQPVKRPKPPINVNRRLGCGQFFIYTGCALLVLMIIAGAGILLLDWIAPDLLYCGSAEPFWRAVLEPILALFNQEFSCEVLIGTR